MLRVCRAMVEKTVQGASSTFAKDMERLSAKESLLLAFKDAGGFEALVTGRTTDVQCIDVNERIIGLERLNPTPRPTTCPNLEGRWNFEWFGVGSPVLVLAKLFFGRIPSTLANLSKLDVLIKDGCGTATAQFKLLNSIENKFIISTKYNVEGPLRMKEEYVEGAFESPKVNQEAVPEQLRGAFGQAFNTVQQIPFPIRDAVSSGMKVPLGGTFQRLILISYLDDEILVVHPWSVPTEQELEMSAFLTLDLGAGVNVGTGDAVGAGAGDGLDDAGYISVKDSEEHVDDAHINLFKKRVDHDDGHTGGVYSGYGGFTLLVGIPPLLIPLQVMFCIQISRMQGPT